MSHTLTLAVQLALPATEVEVVTGSIHIKYLLNTNIIVIQASLCLFRLC